MATEMEESEIQSVEEQTTEILVEFLELAITSILFLKRVYPAGAFERRRYMNAVAQIAREPLLKDYIHSSLAALSPSIEKGLVDKVAVSFFNGGDNMLVERFVFKVEMKSSGGMKIEEADLEFGLRPFLIQLATSESLIKPFLPDCRWEITGHFNTLPEVGRSTEAEVWIPTGTKQWEQPPLITPIKSMSSGPLSLQLYVEHPRLS